MYLILVPLIDLKFLSEPAASDAGTQIGGARVEIEAMGLRPIGAASATPLGCARRARSL
jgi:hypothetical protein